LERLFGGKTGPNGVELVLEGPPVGLKPGEPFTAPAPPWRPAPTDSAALHGLRRFEEAHEAYQQAERIDPRDARTNLNLSFLDPEEVARIETESGESLAIPTDPDRLEATLLARSPADAQVIRAFVGDVRRLGRFRMPIRPGLGRPGRHPAPRPADLPDIESRLQDDVRGVRRAISGPLIRAYFGRGELAQLSAVAVVFSLAWMSVRNAGYAIGGAQAIIRPIEKRLKELGGSIRYCARVERILVENGAAVGAQLAGGETLRGDWVMSAADVLVAAGEGAILAGQAEPHRKCSMAVSGDSVVW
jgi:phytoene dehydrogenase-like protein